ncbi:MAG: hypothetical protein SCH70_13135 [Candidatus Methanoperedens sp.]|nr:hypothetical protein [Candidatus Methanoperedens sp.]
MKKILPVILFILIIGLSGCIDSDSSNENVNADKKYERTNPNLDGKIVEVEFDRDNYIAGEKVTAKLLVANTGNETINNETVEIKAKVVKLDDFLANLFLKTMSDKKKTRTFTINFNKEIKPESIEGISAVFSTQAEMEGKSLAGTYEVTLDLFVNGQYAGTHTLPVTLHKGTPEEDSTQEENSTQEEDTLTPASSPTVTPTPTPTPVITDTPAPTPTPAHETVVVDNPTGVVVPLRVMSNRFTVSEVEINAGDEVLWDNYDDTLYTIVEKNGKIGNLTLRHIAKLPYIFNTTGDYTFSLYDRYTKSPGTQTIKVRVNTTNTS